MSDKPTIVEALSAVMGDVQSVRKGDRNQTQGYQFRGIDAVMNAVGPAFRKHGIVCVPMLEDVAYNTVEVGQKRSVMRECTVRVRYIFHGPAGDRIECVTIGEAMDSGDKATPKAMSVAYRVALLQALTIPTDEPDADAQNYERSEVRQEPTWDPVDQEERFAAWAEEIGQAETPEQLDDISHRLQAESKKRIISRATYQKLGVLGGKRRAEIQPVTS